MRACVRAKLCACVREVLLNAGGPNGNKTDSGRDFGFSSFRCNYSGFYGNSGDVVAIVVGFMAHVQILSLL